MIRTRTLLLVAAGGILALAPGCVSPERKGPPSAHPMYRRAEQAFLSGRLDESRDLYRGYRLGYAGTELEPDSHYWEGLTLLEQGKPAEAAPHLEVAARHARDRMLSALAYTALGDCALAQDRFDEACAHYQRAVDLQVPEARNDYALYRLGVARQRKGDWGGGKSYFDLVLREHPKSPFVARIRERLALPARAFYLDAGTFASRGEADAQKIRIEAAGQKARVVAGDKGGFRVWAGGYLYYEDARDALPQLASLTQTEVHIVP